MAISTNLPIKLSDVTQEIWGTGTTDKTLKGAFAKAAFDGGIFNPTFVGNKDRLTCFLGYQNNCTLDIEITDVDLTYVDFYHYGTIEMTRYEWADKTLYTKYRKGSSIDVEVNDLIYDSDINGNKFLFNGQNKYWVGYPVLYPETYPLQYPAVAYRISTYGVILEIFNDFGY